MSENKNTEEKKSIFRKKAMDRITSPEEMDNYLQVTGPGTWLILIAVILLLAGFVLWGIMGRLDTTLNVAVVSHDNRVTCYIPADKVKAVVKSENGQTVSVAGVEYSFSNSGLAPEIITEETNNSIIIAGQLAEGTVVQPMQVESDLPDGIYSGKIVVETIAPISFILN